MLLRAFAVLATIAIPLLLTIPMVADLLPDWIWLGPALAIAAALPIVIMAKHTRGQALLGAGLAAMAAAASPELPELLAATSDPESLPIHDLRDGPLPPEQTGYVTVRGYLRSDWQVDEYRVSNGDRPDQNQAAAAVLVPLLGTNAAVIEVAGGDFDQVIVARIVPDKLGLRLVTVRGKIGPVAPEIVDSLFAVQIDSQGLTSATDFRPNAVLLDTLELPTRGQAITRLVLAIAAGLLGLVLLIMSVMSIQPIPKPTVPAV